MAGTDKAAGLLAAALMAGAAPPALAHHSFAMFDHDRTITLDAVVEIYQWTNPHGYLTLQAKDGAGTRRYVLEMTSINMLHREGWTSRTVKVGDHVKAVVAPLLDGQNGGLLLELTLPTGKKMLPGVPNFGSFKRTT